MSRVQDTLALIKGLQIVARAVTQQQEACCKHLWVNSSIRELMEQNLTQAKTQAEQFAKNPSKEFENLASFIKETVERTSVAAEGVKELTKTTVTPKTMSNDLPLTSSDARSLDISSITLTELETLLSNRNQKLVKLRNDKIHAPLRPVETSQKESTFTNDENYVKDWMTFIATHGDKNEAASAVVQPEKIADKKSPIVAPELSTKKPGIVLPQLSSVAKQRKVPSSRIGRLATFGGLFAGLGVGTLNELAKGALGIGGTLNAKEALLSPANAERIVDTLCKVRGAALKLGQILSIQDSSVVSPQLVQAFDRVRQAADYMPDWQVDKVLAAEFGPDWRSKLMTFEQKPFAAASIGQVHRGVLLDGTEVAIKIQYPGVAKSIESDIDNLVGMLKVWDVFPAGFFIDNVVKVAKRELVWEVDYIREAEYTTKFREMVQCYPEYRVPKVINDLTTKSVLTTELVPGVPVDKCFGMSYDDRHFVGESVLKLCLRELFTLRCMQTDPNWSNFLYDAENKKLTLIDFGATRFYTSEFINNYKSVIVAAVKNDKKNVLKLSTDMGFLTGYETKQMQDAHVDAVMILGEMFRTNGEFDFGKQNTTKRIAELVPTMVAHRLCPPPEEIYSIHRKLSGVFLLCSRLNIRLNCHPYFEEILNK